MVEREISNLSAGVRFPYPAQIFFKKNLSDPHEEKICLSYKRNVSVGADCSTKAHL